MLHIGCRMANTTMFKRSPLDAVLSRDRLKGSDAEHGYDSGSGDGLFEPPPDPVMDAARDAMVEFAPSGERQQRVRDYLRGKDNNGSGKVISTISKNPLVHRRGLSGTAAIIQQLYYEQGIECESADYKSPTSLLIAFEGIAVSCVRYVAGFSASLVSVWRVCDSGCAVC